MRGQIRNFGFPIALIVLFHNFFNDSSGFASHSDGNIYFLWCACGCPRRKHLPITKFFCIFVCCVFLRSWERRNTCKSCTSEIPNSTGKIFKKHFIFLERKGGRKQYFLIFVQASALQFSRFSACVHFWRLSCLPGWIEI